MTADSLVRKFTKQVYKLSSSIYIFEEIPRMSDIAEVVIGDKKQYIKQDALMFNIKNLELFHISLAIVAGVAAGILGLTSLRGLYLFLVVSVLSIFGLLFKMKFDSGRYMIGSILQFEFSMLSGQVLTYILFWTFAYAIVHLY